MQWDFLVLSMLIVLLHGRTERARCRLLRGVAPQLASDRLTDNFLSRALPVVAMLTVIGLLAGGMVLTNNAADWLLVDRMTVMGGLLLLALLLNSFYWWLFRRRLDPVLNRWNRAELRESEERFRSFADNAPLLLQITDAESKHSFFNETWREFVGWTTEEKNEDWLGSVHPSDREALAAGLATAFERRAVHQAEFRMRHAAGDYRWLMALYIPRWQESNFAGYMGACVDITTHKHLEQALEYKVEFEKLLATISANFVNPGPAGIEGAIKATLGEIGRFTGAERAYIFVFADDMSIAYYAHGWEADGVRPMAEEIPVLVMADTTWFHNEFMTKGRLIIPRVSDLPAAAAKERQKLEAEGIKSLVAVPITAGERLFGFLGFQALGEEKNWQESDLVLPKLAGEVIVGALRRRQAEADLEKSEAKNEAIIDALPDMMYHVDRRGVILDFKPSRQHPELFPNGLLGGSIGKIIPVHLVKPALDAINEALDCGEVKLFEFYQQEESKTSFFEARVSRASDDDVLVIVRDISERRHSEACDLLLLDIAVKVLEEEPLEDIMAFACQQIRAIFGLKLVWIGHKEAGGTVRLFSTGEEASECIQGISLRWDETPQGSGPTGTAIRTGKFQLVDAGDVQSLPWSERLARYDVTSGVSFPLRVRGLILGALTAYAPDRSFWSKRTIVHLTNFAEQLALAELSTTSRQRLKLLTTGLESAANAVIITDRVGNFQWVNPAFLALTGFAAQAAMAQNARVMLAGPQPRAFYRNLWQHILHGKAWQGEIASRTTDGRRYIAELTVTPVRDESGEVANFIAIIQDVTQRRQAEQDMLEARETVARAERLSSLGIMAAGIAHEVNQPLNSLKVIADGMLYWHKQGKTPTFAKMMENIEKISKQADRIDSIIKHMRSFVRNSQRVEPYPCDLNKAVGESMSLLGTQLVAHGIQVKIGLAVGLMPVLANDTHLEEIVINLLVNAMQSLDTVSKEGKQITITTGRLKEGVFLEISDNGPGISRKNKGKIFEPFFTTKPAGEGMGLGLSIIHSIVTSYGGRITVKSVKQQDEGVAFRLEFPAYAGTEKGEKQA